MKIKIDDKQAKLLDYLSRDVPIKLGRKLRHSKVELTRSEAKTLVPLVGIELERIKRDCTPSEGLNARIAWLNDLQEILQRK